MSNSHTVRRYRVEIRIAGTMGYHGITVDAYTAADAVTQACLRQGVKVPDILDVKPEPVASGEDKVPLADPLTCALDAAAGEAMGLLAATFPEGTTLTCGWCKFSDTVERFLARHRIEPRGCRVDGDVPMHAYACVMCGFTAPVEDFRRRHVAGGVGVYCKVDGKARMPL